MIRTENASVVKPLVRASALARHARAHASVQQSGVHIEVRHPLAMLDLRSRTDADFHAIERAIDAVLPGPRTSSQSLQGDILWLAPGQWLLVSADETRWREDIGVPGATLCDVSHGRVAVRVTGPDVRAALGKGCMLDLHRGEFVPGACAQTVVARMNVLVHHRHGNDSVFDLYVARSYAGSFWHWLTEAAEEYGCAVVDTTGRP